MVSEKASRCLGAFRVLLLRQINLLILLNEPRKIFFIMDGQHRCRVMERLHRRTGRDIKFQFRAKAVSDEALP